MSCQLAPKDNSQAPTKVVPPAVQLSWNSWSLNSVLFSLTLWIHLSIFIPKETDFGNCSLWLNILLSPPCGAGFSLLFQLLTVLGCDLYITHE